MGALHCMGLANPNVNLDTDREGRDLKEVARSRFPSSYWCPSIDGAAGAVSGSPAVEGAGSTTKAYSPSSGPHPEAKKDSSKAREDVLAIQKVKVNSVGLTALDSKTTSSAFVASNPSEHSLAFDIFKTAAQAGGRKKARTP